jgi:parallel beta-helix repeat protein
MKKAVSGIMFTLLILTSMLTLALNIQPGRAWSGTVYIRADGSIDPSDAPIYTVDKITYTLTNIIASNVIGIVVEKGNVIIDGNGFTITGNGTFPSIYGPCPPPFSAGIYVKGVSNVTIRNVGVRKFYYGILLEQSENNITRCNLAENQIGIWLNYSSCNNILGNNITNDITGIVLWCSSNNVISWNNITNSYDESIYLYCSSNNVVSENNITNNGCGISSYCSFYNMFSRNNIINNYAGIGLTCSFNNVILGNNISRYLGYQDTWGIIFFNSSNNVISENTIANNYVGIRLGNSSLDNGIYHNNFIGNTKQVLLLEVGYANVWDHGYPSGGNYWSDYTGVDEKSGAEQDQPGSDGIGDTPYFIDAYNVDRYPLMKPYSPTIIREAEIIGVGSNAKLLDSPNDYLILPGEPITIFALVHNKGSVRLHLKVSIKVADPKGFAVFDSSETGSDKEVWLSPGESTLESFSFTFPSKCDSPIYFVFTTLSDWDDPNKVYDSKGGWIGQPIILHTIWDTGNALIMHVSYTRKPPSELEQTLEGAIIYGLKQIISKAIGEVIGKLGGMILSSILGVFLSAPAAGNPSKVDAYLITDSTAGPVVFIDRGDEVHLGFNIFEGDEQLYGITATCTQLYPQTKVIWSDTFRLYEWDNFYLGGLYVGFLKREISFSEDGIYLITLNGASTIAVVGLPSLLVTAESPVDLMLTDPAGRRVGYSPDAGVVNEIDGAFYSGPSTEPEIIAIPYPSVGNYMLNVYGTGTGNYTIRMRNTNVNATFVAYNIPIINNATHQYLVDWDALSMGGKGVTVKVDSDGDGVFEHTFTSDNELTQDEYLIATSDETPPQTQLSISEPKFIVNNVTYLTSATLIELIAEDNPGGSGVASTAYRIYNASYDSGWITYTEPFYLTVLRLSDGPYQIDYNSTDYAGNVESTNTVTVFLDNTPPTTSLTIGEPKYISDTTYVAPDTPFTLKANDNAGAGIYSMAYRIYNGTYESGWLTYTDPFYLTGLADGVYTIEFNSADNLGNTESAKSIQVTLFSWNYIFTDSYGRGTTLKINLAHKFFQFITPDKDYGIRKATYMRQCGRAIIIHHYDDELRLITTAVDTKLDFCVAIAWDTQTGKRYFLIDKAEKINHNNNPKSSLFLV